MDAINFFAMHKIKIKRMHFYRQFIASSESYLQSAVLSLMINRNLIEKSWIREFKHRLKLHWKYDEYTIMSISLKIKVLLKHMFCVWMHLLSMLKCKSLFPLFAFSSKIWLGIIIRLRITHIHFHNRVCLHFNLCPAFKSIVPIFNQTNIIPKYRFII